MLKLRKIDIDLLDGHAPFVHPIASAPPKAKWPLRSLSSLDFINGSPGPLCFLIGKLSYITHTGEEYDRAFGIGADIGIVGKTDAKRLLLFKYPCRLSGGSLRRTENEVDC